MPVNSKAKGKAGELEVAALLRSFGFEARRGQQYCGGGDSPDVMGLDGFHIEVKRTEKFDLEGAMEQAKRDKKDEEIPVVFHRKSKRAWVVVLDANDFLAMVKAFGFSEE